MNKVCLHNSWRILIITFILLITVVDTAISAEPSVVTRDTKEEALAEQERLRRLCIEEIGGQFPHDYPPTKITQYDEEKWRFQWICLVCETSPGCYC